MRKKYLEKFYKDFRKKRDTDDESSDDAIINQVFKESTHHPMYKNELINYVYQKLNESIRLKREAREKQEGVFEKDQERKIKRATFEIEELKRNKTEQDMLEGAKETEKRDEVDKEILDGKISQEDLIDPKYNREGMDHRRISFGPLK